MAEGGGIKNYFHRVDGPLPIRWTPSAEPQSKKLKRGPGRPRKPVPAIQAPNISDEDEIKDQNDEEDIESVKKTRRVYTVERIVAYSKKHSAIQSSKHFDVPRTTILRWTTDGYFEQNTTKKGIKKGGGRPVTYEPDIDQQLLAWLLDARDKQLPITTQLLRAKGLEMITPQHPEFKASHGWVQKFKARHLLVLRVKTSLAQELPMTLEERIKAFQMQLGRN